MAKILKITVPTGGSVAGATGKFSGGDTLYAGSDRRLTTEPNGAPIAAVSDGATYAINGTPLTLPVALYVQPNGELGTAQNGAPVDVLSDGSQSSQLLKNSHRSISLSGDSITANAIVITGRAESWRCIGWGAWFRRIMGDRVLIEPKNIFAVPSMTTDHLISVQLPQVLASGCAYNIMMMGNNDAFGSEDTIANYDAYFDALENAGITAIAMPVLPHSPPASYDANRQAQVSAMNRYLRQRQEQRRNFHYVDTLSTVTNFATGDAIAGFHRDGVHTTIEGAKRLAEKVAETVGALITGDPRIALNLTANQYHATYNPKGNILPNPTLAGTSGNATNGATGDVADDWGVWRRGSAVNLTVACSKGTLAGYNNLPTQVITLGGQGDAGTDNYVLALPDTPAIPSDWKEGDVVEASMWVKTNNITQIRGLALHVQLGDTVSFYDGVSYDGTVSDGGTHESDGLYLYKTRFTIGAGSNFFFRFYIYPVAGAAMSCSVELAQPTLVKIA